MKRFAFKAVVLLTLAACTEPTRPAAPRPPQADVALSVATACPTPANVVVHDQASLLAALGAAYPGEVIGLDGFFGISADVTIATPGVTLTCVTPGSGLFAVSSSGVQDVVIAAAKNVVVDRLILDGSQAGDSPLAAFNDLATFFAEGIRFTNNTATCTPGGECVNIQGGLGPVVTDNRFQAADAFAGIHLQPDAAPIDGARIERNGVVATTPSCCPNQGGIRLFGATNVVIADNTVLGPWANSLSVQALTTSLVERNQSKGAARYGILFSGNPNFPTLLMLNNTFRSNVANGAFDCDSDGVNVPNIITGAGAVTHGVTLGGVVSDAVRTTRGHTLQ